MLRALFFLLATSVVYTMASSSTCDSANAEDFANREVMVFVMEPLRTPGAAAGYDSVFQVHETLYQRRFQLSLELERDGFRLESFYDDRYILSVSRTDFGKIKATDPRAALKVVHKVYYLTDRTNKDTITWETIDLNKFSEIMRFTEWMTSAGIKEREARQRTPES